MAEPLLDVKDLTVHFKTDDGIVKAVDGVSYSIQPGETLGIVGESGSGKSVSSLTVMGLTDSKYAEISGEVIFQGVDLLKLPQDEMRNIRGAKISMIFQDPMTSLHPFYRWASRSPRRSASTRTSARRRRSARRSRCSAR